MKPVTVKHRVNLVYQNHLSTVLPYRIDFQNNFFWRLKKASHFLKKSNLWYLTVHIYTVPTTNIESDIPFGTAVPDKVLTWLTDYPILLPKILCINSKTKIELWNFSLGKNCTYSFDFVFWVEMVIPHQGIWGYL